MKLSALILLVALVMATSVRADPCPHPKKTAPGQCQGAGDFNFCLMGAIANPDPSSPGYTPPPACNTTTPPALFQTVYELLKSNRNDVNIWLCSLTNLISQTGGGTQDVGIWEVPDGMKPNGNHRDKVGRGGMYIALQSTLPQRLADQENVLLAAALGVPLSRIVAHNDLPWFTSTDQPAQGMALLSILAHELGHLLLAQTNADGTGNAGHTHPRSLLCDKPGNRGASSNTCFDTNFVPPTPGTTLWNSTTFYPGMRRWIAFGDRNGNQYRDPTRDLGTVRGLVNTNPSGANAAINTLLTEFVSVFAALSPEEDVVETYKYKILADVAKASNLTLNFPAGGPHSVLVLNNVPPAGSNLQKKASCVTSLPQ